MESLRNLSGLTKASVAAIILFSIGSLLGQIVVPHLFWIMPYTFSLLVAQSITVALNDPEAEVPAPLWLRALIGYGIGIPIGFFSWMIHNAITIKVLPQ